MTEPYDPDVYSDRSTGVPGSLAIRRMTWRELAEDFREKLGELELFRQMVIDLDRNEHGRHEGDADVGDPSGVSQGNPRLHTGDVLGYGLGGAPYVMPERGKRHDPRAWGAR